MDIIENLFKHNTFVTHQKKKKKKNENYRRNF